MEDPNSSPALQIDRHPYVPRVGLAQAFCFCPVPRAGQASLGGALESNAKADEGIIKNPIGRPQRPKRSDRSLHFKTLTAEQNEWLSAVSGISGVDQDKRA